MCVLVPLFVFVFVLVLVLVLVLVILLVLSSTDLLKAFARSFLELPSRIHLSCVSQ